MCGYPIDSVREKGFSPLWRNSKLFAAALSAFGSAGSCKSRGSRDFAYMREHDRKRIPSKPHSPANASCAEVLCGNEWISQRVAHYWRAGLNIRTGRGLPLAAKSIKTKPFEMVSCWGTLLIIILYRPELAQLASLWKVVPGTGMIAMIKSAPN